MRLLAIILMILFALVGAVFGALNADLVSYDLVLGSLAVPKGAALLASLLLGWVLGGAMVWLFALQPLRRRLRKARRELDARGTVREPEPPPA